MGERHRTDKVENLSHLIGKHLLPFEIPIKTLPQLYLCDPQRLLTSLFPLLKTPDYI